jgi:L-alanine-DL-glutamate epimerase-like enolase superfamily enzyme
MRIADIEVTTLLFEYPKPHGFRYAGGACTHRTANLVQVRTECGRTGIGSVYSHPDLVRTVIEQQLAPSLLGADPTEVEALWRKMYLDTRWYGRKGAAMSALGGLDTAFWDLRGQKLGKPVRELLAPGARNAVPAYASGLLWHDSEDSIAAEAAQHRANGFRRMKMRLGYGGDRDLAMIDAVRRGADGADVMVDGSMRYDLAGATLLAAELAKRGIFWFEEPFEPDAVEDFAALRKVADVPIAAGENEFGVEGFAELLRMGAVDIVQADACRAGGISVVRKVGEMAQNAGCRLAPHTWSDAVTIVANAQVVAGLPNAITVEMDRTGNPMVDALLEEPLVVRDGQIALSDAPGLGIRLNAQTVAALAWPKGKPLPAGQYSDMWFTAPKGGTQ